LIALIAKARVLIRSTDRQSIEQNALSGLKRPVLLQTHPGI